mgnify:CR=1 FL=1
MKNIKTIAIVPARGGSKGLKDKNIATVDGIPLICHTLNQLNKCKKIDRILLSTDSNVIKDIAESYGFKVPFLRDPIFAQDETTMEETLKHALNQSEDYWREKFDICVYTSPTDIFRESKWIDNLINKLEVNNSLESAFMGIRSFRNFWSFETNKKPKRVMKYMEIYGQRQERLKNQRYVIQECTGIGCASRSFLWRNGRRIGDKVHIEILPSDYQECDIHTKKDLEILRNIYKSKNNVN